MAKTAEKTTELTPDRPPRADLTDAEKLFIPKLDPTYVWNDELSNEIGFDIGEGKKVLLTGHMGTGKTMMFLQLAARISQPVVRINLNGQATIADFVGYNTVINGNIEWIDGLLTMAVRRGFWIILDELDAADASVLFVVQALAEKNGVLTLKERGSEVIVPNKHFRMLATANTVGIMEDFRHLYQGTQQMNAALLDRFRVHHITWLPQQDEIDILTKAVPGCPAKAAKVLVKLATHVRKAFDNEELDRTFSLRSLIDLTEMMMRVRAQQENKATGPKMTPDEMIMKAVNTCILSKVSRRDGEVIKVLTQKIAENPE